MEKSEIVSKDGLLPPSGKKGEIKDKLSLLLEIIWLLLLIIPAILVAFYRKVFPPPQKSLKGQIALVTGAGRGLGKGLALGLAKEGCKVAVVDVNMESAESTAKEIRSTGGQARAYMTNVAKTQDIKELHEAITKDFGPVDLLVNNAGIIFAEPIEHCTEEAVSGIISINLLSHFWMTREFLPSMKERNFGHIVAMASASSFTPVVNASAYAVSKCGIRGFMEGLRDELRTNPGNNIKTTILYPYFVDTSVDYLEHWDLRIPPLSIERVVDDSIEAIKRDDLTLTIPQHLYWVTHVRRLFPECISDMIKKIFYVRLILPTEDTIRRIPQCKILKELAAERR